LRGTIPSNIHQVQGYIETLDLSNTFLEGTIPSIFEILINLQTLDLSNTSLCGCFPKRWNYINWRYCNVEGIYHNCDCTLLNCEKTSPCNKGNTVICGENQCKDNTHLCQDGRQCIFNEGGWGYTCSDCSGSSFDNAGFFKCQMKAWIISVICIGAILLILLVTVLIYFRRRQVKIYSDFPTKDELRKLEHAL